MNDRSKGVDTQNDYWLFKNENIIYGPLSLDKARELAELDAKSTLNWHEINDLEWYALGKGDWFTRKEYKIKFIKPKRRV